MSTDQQPERLDSARRTTSFGSIIKRSKSNDLLGERKSSGRLRKKSLEGERRSSIKNTPPALPIFSPQPVIESFGGEDYTPPPSMSTRTASSLRDAPPVPPVPADLQQAAVDPYARTESMTHRSRYSYAHSTTSTVNSPRRVRRRKDPTPYNILVIGAKNSGKTSFINFLKTSLALPPRKQPPRSADQEYGPPTSKAYSNFTHHYREIEVDHERVGLTLWDSEGLEKGVIDLQLRELTNFVESKFEETFAEEMKVVRSPGVRDTEIHCVFMILDPSRLDTNIQLAQEAPSSTSSRIGKSTRILGILDEDFDLQVLKSFQGKTTVVPIISKADTITTAHMAHLKQMVWQSLKKAGLDPLEALNVAQDNDDQIEEDNEDASPPESSGTDDSDGELKNGNARQQVSHNRSVSKSSVSSLMMDSGYVPMSILSPDRYSLDMKNGPVGRHFPWGFADPYNAEHCDFVKLKDAVFSEWRNEVRTATRENFYERWRTNRLNRQAAAKVTSNSAQPRKSSAGIPIQLKGAMNRF